MHIYNFIIEYFQKKYMLAHVEKLYFPPFEVFVFAHNNDFFLLLNMYTYSTISFMNYFYYTKQNYYVSVDSQKGSARQLILHFLYMCFYIYHQNNRQSSNYNVYIQSNQLLFINHLLMIIFFSKYSLF